MARGRARARWLIVACAALLSACAEGSTPAPEPGMATLPPGWVAVSSSTHDFELLVPPWLIPFDTDGAIFANEVLPAPGAEIPFQLMAIGPRGDGQPQPGQDLGAWIHARLADRGGGVPAVARIALPAGPAVRYERIDRPGTAQAWHFVAYAIVTPRGTAYLQLDGPQASWADRSRIPDAVAATFRLL